MSQPSFVPEGYNAIIPALAIKDAARAIEWYKEVFGVTEKMVLTDASGAVAHAELVFGGSVFMLGEENPQYNQSPKTLNGNSMTLCMYVQDVDAVMQKCVDKGARIVMPAEDQFYGDRSGRIEDPFGYVWILATHVKDVSEEEMKAMMAEWSGQPD